MKILVTNDDGIFAEGIYKLASALNSIHNVYVVAPDRQRSATGHAITMHHPLRVKKVKFFDTDIKAWSVDGTPSDCVKLGIEALLKEAPDIVISGINDGPNLGTDVLYSGTVSAAIEGAIQGVQSVAVSMVGFEKLNYDTAASFSSIIVDKLIRTKLPKDTLLNVNVPNLLKDEIKGIRVTTLGTRKYDNSFIRREDPRGQEYYWLGGKVIEEVQDTRSDINAINDQYISVTPIHYDLTKFDLIEKIEKWNLNY